MADEGGMDKERAEIARTDSEFLEAFLDSNVGKRLTAELDKIDEQATNSAMRGKTPLSHDEYMEGRGKMLATKQIRGVFDDVRNDAKNAVTWLQENSIKSNTTK